MESSIKTPVDADEKSSTSSSLTPKHVSSCKSLHEQRHTEEERKCPVNSLLSMSYDVIKMHSFRRPMPEHTYPSKKSTEHLVDAIVGGLPGTEVISNVNTKKERLHSGIDIDRMNITSPVHVKDEFYQTEGDKSTQDIADASPQYAKTSGIPSVPDHDGSATNTALGHGTSSATTSGPQASTSDGELSPVPDKSTSKDDFVVPKGIDLDMSVGCYQDSDKGKLDCSFTDSDDTNSHYDHSEHEEDLKKGPDDFFQLMFDIDEDSRSSSGSASESGSFLTCSVCGKELPEGTRSDGGKELCNTCKLVRMEADSSMPKKSTKWRKKAVTSQRNEHLSNPETITCYIIDKDTAESLVPLRKSARKRVSTISIKDYLPVDVVSDEDFVGITSNKRKVKTSERKPRILKSNHAPTKSKYTQQLNLTPVIKPDPDKVDDDAVDEPKEEIAKVETVPEYTDVKKKMRGRPKGSKNKAHSAKETKAPKETQKDVSFNKRWHRAFGPVPDTNPDADDGLWSCEFCSKSFLIRRNFLAHRRKHSGRHNCTECDETFECNSKLQRHIRRHRGEKPFTCHLCPKAYSENIWLQRHLAVHLAEGHSPLPKPYQCNICGRQYTHKGTMIYHVKTHTETKFYQCDVCGKQFTHRSSLECHIKTHTGAKPYACNICGKRFADRSVQLRHTRSHSGEKPYKCSVCEKGFTQSGTLNIHMRLHTSEKPYKCKLCDVGFLKRIDLSKHSKTHLGELLSNNINLITCRVTENKGDDIQKKAAQIIIDAYGERKPDGSIEIKTRQLEHSDDRYPIQQMDAVIYSRPGEVAIGSPQDLTIKHDMVHLTHEDIQRRALEFIALKRQHELEGLLVADQPIVRPVTQTFQKEVPVVDHQAVGLLLDDRPMDPRNVAQQTERHVLEPQPMDPSTVAQQIDSHVTEPQPIMDPSTVDKQMVSDVTEHQPIMDPRTVAKQMVSDVTEPQPIMDPSTVAQQIEKHVQEHAGEQQLLAQVEGQL